MARKIDPAIETILKQYGLKGADVLWDCHGTWCMYHRSLEKIAADQRITFMPPQVIEANGVSKSVAICVTGTIPSETTIGGSRMEWSIGEAAPGNNKNAYPYAMAEKRAKDRVILKLIGLHGLVYSEEEMPEGEKVPATAQSDNAALDSKAMATDFMREITLIATDPRKTKLDLQAWLRTKDMKPLTEPDYVRVSAHYKASKASMKEGKAA